MIYCPTMFRPIRIRVESANFYPLTTPSNDPSITPSSLAFQRSTIVRPFTWVLVKQIGRVRLLKFRDGPLLAEHQVLAQRIRAFSRTLLAIGRIRQPLRSSRTGIPHLGRTMQATCRAG